jgi:aminopeptidase
MPATSQVAPDHKLERYGELTVRVALNLQPGQRLLIIGPLMNGGVSLDAAPLVRHIAASAYRAGAELVEAMWGDEALQLARFGMRRATPSANSRPWAAQGLGRARRSRQLRSCRFTPTIRDLLQHESTDLAARCNRPRRAA